MKHKNKKYALHVHASRRASERYNIRLSNDKEQEIVRAIQTHRAQFIEKQSVRVSVFDVIVDDKIVRVVYDCHRKCLITFIPREVRQDG